MSNAIDKAIRQMDAENGRLAPIHRFLDSRPVSSRTWHYELAVRMGLEAFLLVCVAFPVVTGWRSLLAQTLLGLLRFAEAWLSHAGKSIRGRASEQGLVPAWHHAHPEKARALKRLAWCEQWTYWAWPVLIPAVLAAEQHSLTIGVCIAINATMARKMFDQIALPVWRRSRRAWVTRNV
jgi:hypothetical protein